MKKATRILTAVASVCALFITAASCTENKNEIPYGKNLSAEVLYNGNEQVALPEGFKPTMMLDSVKVFGSTGINRYFGNYTFDEKTGAIRFEPIGMTMMAGPDMEKEDLFVKAMNKARYFKMGKDSTYVLMDSLKNDLVIFRIEPQQAAEKAL